MKQANEGTGNIFRRRVLSFIEPKCKVAQQPNSPTAFSVVMQMVHKGRQQVKNQDIFTKFIAPILRHPQTERSN